MADAASLAAVGHRLIALTTGSDDGPAVLDALCLDLLAAGLPVWRVSLAVPAIDPTLLRMSLVWRRGVGVDFDNTEHGEGGAEKFARSPIGWLTVRGLTEGGWRLDGPEPPPDIPLLAHLAREGATEYLQRLTPFAPQTAIHGVGISFATDRPGGFTASERGALGDLMPLMALVTGKLTLAHTLRETLGVYLGPATGTRVLSGEARRGQGRTVHAAILLADLRGFTALTDREDPQRVVAWLDEHFDALAGPVLRHGGEVSKFLGDGFLAVFAAADPDADVSAACIAALGAAREAEARNAALNQARRTVGGPMLPADMVLHYGPVVAGNIGADRRLDFTVIGRAVNEASRIEKLCEEVGASLLASDAFARRCGTAMVDRGEYALRGVARRARIWTLPAVD